MTRTSFSISIRRKKIGDNSRLNEERFNEMRSKQGLEMEYGAFVTVLMKSLNQLEDEKSR